MFRWAMDEVHQSPALHFAHHVGPGIRLPVGIGVLEIPVQVHPPGPILVDEAVPVFVRPLPVQGVAARLLLGGVGSLHQTCILRIHHIVPVGSATRITVTKPSPFRSSGPSSSASPSLSSS